MLQSPRQPRRRRKRPPLLKPLSMPASDIPRKREPRAGPTRKKKSAATAASSASSAPPRRLRDTTTLLCQPNSGITKSRERDNPYAHDDAVVPLHGPIDNKIPQPQLRYSLLSRRRKLSWWPN